MIILWPRSAFGIRYGLYQRQWLSIDQPIDAEINISWRRGSTFGKRHVNTTRTSKNSYRMPAAPARRRAVFIVPFSQEKLLFRDMSSENLLCDKWREGLCCLVFVRRRARLAWRHPHWRLIKLGISLTDLNQLADRPSLNSN
jgi:hypothetical protein